MKFVARRPSKIHLNVNGKEITLPVGDSKNGVLPHHTLSYTLREKLNLKGTKVSCESGSCGACTVLLDGKAVLSCMILTIECDGKTVTTIEGLSENGKLDPIQEAFIRNSAFQCGFCTPGMIMAVKGLLLNKPSPNEEEIKEALSGHFCRCISHYHVLDAVKEVVGLPEGEKRLIRASEPKELRLIGREIPRVDAKKIVTGEIQYLSDLRFEKLLYGRVLRSPHPHAYIKRIDVSKAKRLEGVRAVLTWADVPDLRGGTPRFKRILDRKVRFFGDAVAILAAEDEDTADEALRLIEVEYEVLEPLIEPEEALKRSDLALYDEFPDNLLPAHTSFFGPKSLKELRMGDIEEGIREADAVIEGEISYSGMPNPIPIEAPGVIALWEEPNRLTLWVSNQCSFLDKVTLSHIFGKDVIVRTIGLPCGGSFGTKLMSWQIQIYAALLSKETHMPVKILLKKDEHIATFTLRPAVKLKGKVGMKKDMTLTLVSGDLTIDTGYYSFTTQAQLAVGLGEVQIMARSKSYDLRPKIVVTNRNASGIVRGFGGQEIKAVLIPLLYRAMERLDIDPFEFFKKNFLKPGDGYFWRDGNYYVYRGIDFSRAMEEGAKVFGWSKKWKGWLRPTYSEGRKRRGVGVAVHGNADIGEDISEAFVFLHPEGRATLLSCVTEHGTGQITNYLKMVAEVLGLPLERVELSPADSLFTPFEFGPVGSRGTYAIGSAVIAAAEDAKKRLMEMASRIMNVRVEDLRTSNGYVYLSSDPAKSLPWYKIIGWERTVSGYGRFEPDYTLTNCIMTFVEVEVDLDLGEVSIVEIVNATDVGRILDPKGLEGQLNGCLGSAGIDTAIFEETVIDKKRGMVLNANLIDYKWRTFLELPRIRHVVFETPCPTHRFEAIGVGEVATSAGPPATFMAVCNAIGKWLNDYPLTPDKILEALR